MKARIGALVLAGTFTLAAAIPLTAMAGPKGTAAQDRTRSGQQIRDQKRDGSCVTPQKDLGAAQKKGNTYGPGDGSGNAGSGPKDGTGYGAPARR